MKYRKPLKPMTWWRLVVGVFLFFATAINSYAQNPKAEKRRPEQKSFFGRFEDFNFSRHAIVPTSVIWVGTCHQLLTNPREFEGDDPSVNFYGHHLHVGFILQVTGATVKKNYPKLYPTLPRGLRLAFNVGPLIMLDDANQHLILQKKDDFGLDGEGREPSASPIHKAYEWSLAPGRTGPQKNMLLLLKRGKWQFSGGFYQGPATELSYNIFETNRVGLSMTTIANLKYNKNQEVAFKNAVFGFKDYVDLSVVRAEFGTGYSLNDQRLVVFYGFTF